MKWNTCLLWGLQMTVVVKAHRWGKAKRTRLPPLRYSSTRFPADPSRDRSEKRMRRSAGSPQKYRSRLGFCRLFPPPSLFSGCVPYCKSKRLWLYPWDYATTFCLFFLQFCHVLMGNGRGKQVELNQEMMLDELPTWAPLFIGRLDCRQQVSKLSKLCLYQRLHY